MKTVETADDDLKLHVVIFIFVLNLAHIWGDLNALDSFLHESCSNLCLGFSNVSLPEQKLSVQVGDINCICQVLGMQSLVFFFRTANELTHVNNMDILEPG